MLGFSILFQQLQRFGLGPSSVIVVVVVFLTLDKMANRWTVFEASVRHVLQGWPALSIAQQQGFGGSRVSEKLEWLLDVIVQIFRDNGMLNG